MHRDARRGLFVGGDVLRLSRERWAVLLGGIACTSQNCKRPVLGHRLVHDHRHHSHGWSLSIASYVIAYETQGATNGFVTANFILGMANLSNPDYVIQRWHTVLVSWVVGILAAVINVFLPRLLNRISTAALCWNVLTFFVVIITILTTNDHKQPSSFVWKVSIAVICLLHRPSGRADSAATGLSKFYRVRTHHGYHGWALTVLLRHVLLRCPISHDRRDEKCVQGSTTRDGDVGMARGNLRLDFPGQHLLLRRRYSIHGSEFNRRTTHSDLFRQYRFRTWVVCSGINDDDD